MSGTGFARGWTPKFAAAAARFGTIVNVRTFLALVGLVYFVAFVSFGVQAMGLVGSHGLLPVHEFLPAIRESLGGRAAWWDAPGLLWFSASDAAIRALWIVGAICAVLAIVGRCQRPPLAACLILWLSICTAGQDFLSFQWDVLLLETGFLALFADATRVRILLFRWLLFRLMFYSGAIKLLSGDPTWRNLTALSYHYETQPLPTPLAWYMHQLPLGFQRASTALVFVIELLVPFLFFAPRRLRHVGAALTIALQGLILLTGNYTFFNWLTIFLCAWLFIEPVKTAAARPRLHAAVSAALAAFIGITSGLLTLELFSIPLPAAGAEWLHAIAPLRIVNSYGLFANMTTSRPEIIVEGSNDGLTWSAYEFPYKPGDVWRAPPVVAPYQPRLDWQMWFAALGSYQQNRWFVTFIQRLLEGDSAVLRLLRYNPFPDHPPKYVRAQLYLYRFTHSGERAWWSREERGTYFPAVSLK